MSISSFRPVALLSILFLLFFTLLIAAPQPAAAAFDLPPAGVDLNGYAWSAYGSAPNLEGIGWISMNCSNTGTCGTSDYAVSIENSGNLTGYAWSSTVGWISFNPAGPYPSGSGVVNNSARVTSGSFTGNLNLGGWARVCSAAANPATCSGGTSPNAGGWDGWIALSGSSAGGYGITMTPSGAANGASNYAWGGPLVTGWIDFSPSGYGPVEYDIVAPTITILSPTTPQPVGPVTITFDPISGGGVPDSCTISDGTTTSPIALSSPVTSVESVTVNTASDTTYTVTCTNVAGTQSATVDVDVYSDLIIEPIEIVPGTANNAGLYQNISFTIPVSGVPSDASNVPYTIDIGGSTVSGTFDGSSAVAGVVTIIESVSGVPYSATPVPWTVTVDPTSGAQPDGVVYEGGGVSEVNESTGTQSLPAPGPEITIDVESIIRTGTQTTVNVAVTSVGITTCSMFGPGLTGDPAATFTVPAGSTRNVSVDTASLTNRTNVAVECSVLGGSSVIENEAIEVTASLQEV